MLMLAAFSYHPDMEVARSRLDAARAAVVTARQRPNPTADFSPQYTSNSPSGTSPWVLAFVLDIPVETAGKRGFRVAAAERRVEAARLDVASAAWNVRSRLRSAILRLFAADRAVLILAAEQAVLEESVTLFGERLKAGEASGPDVALAQLALGRTQLALREEDKAGAEARAEVSGAIGVPISALEGVALSFSFLEQTPAPGEFEAPTIRRRALLGRSDVLAALSAYDAAESALHLEIAKQYPDIIFGPGYEFDQGENKWGVGLGAVLPILNRNQGPIAEAEVRRKESASRFTALQFAVLADVDRGLASYEPALRKLEAADRAAAAARGLAESAKARHDQGETGRLALLAAQAALQASLLSRHRALVEAQEALGALEDAVQSPLAAGEAAPAVSTGKNAASAAVTTNLAKERNGT